MHVVGSARPRIVTALLLAVMLGAVVSIARADNTDQNSAGSKYAWSENTGWLSGRPAAEPYGPGGSGMQVSDTEVTGYLWGENIGWVNLSCKNDSSCGGAAGSWGIKNNGAGVLSGYAWGENVGWINFSCLSDASCGGAAGTWGVAITHYDTSTEHAQAGVFSGYAWGENIGWISFNCANDGSCASGNYQLQTGAPDSSGDGYTDAQKIALSKNPWSYCAIMRADVNGDGDVNTIDLASVGKKFALTVPPASARLDQNADTLINTLDLAALGKRFTKSVTSC